MEDARPSFIDLYWEDILYTKVLPLLSIKDLFSMRRVSTRYKLLIDSYFSRMKVLNLSPFSQVFNGAALQVLRQHCTHLHVVMMANCNWLTDDLLIPLLENNVSITKLILNNCSRLSSICLQPVMINCKNLKILSLANCKWMTIGCLHALTLHQHSLEGVDFSGCSLIDNGDSLNNFLMLSPKIKVLNLSRLGCVNDTTLSVLARAAKQLETLNITACLNVTGYGMSLLIEYCRNLESVFCGDCPLVHNGLKIPATKNIQLIPPYPCKPDIILCRLNV
uniref:F-box/LRR-repeat protein 15-like leucin rich repeat domain-containing protein n=1 Tax=Cuerna arida TaxID=1464854 RepID=A0A1B6GMC0_9HEMI